MTQFTNQSLASTDSSMQFTSSSFIKKTYLRFSKADGRGGNACVGADDAGGGAGGRGAGRMPRSGRLRPSTGEKLFLVFKSCYFSIQERRKHMYVHSYKKAHLRI